MTLFPKTLIDWASMKSLLVLLAASAGCAAAPRPLELVAHRGASLDAPENSLDAFRLGWAQAQANELDIHLTRDGRLAVIHDASTKRTAGVDKPVAQQTMHELKALGVPALEEVLALLPEGRRLFIEIKCGAEALPELKRVLNASGRPPEQLAIIGFSHDTMRQAKRLLPLLEVYWLVSSKEDEASKKAPDLDVLITRACEAGLDGLDLHHGFPIDAAFVSRVQAAGLKLYTWTVDDPVIARRQAAAGVDGITTNRPGWLRQQLPAGR
jgi:glycerophosphoryl diester phosphodiesterase